MEVIMQFHLHKDPVLLEIVGDFAGWKGLDLLKTGAAIKLVGVGHEAGAVEAQFFETEQTGFLQQSFQQTLAQAMTTGSTYIGLVLPDQPPLHRRVVFRAKGHVHPALED